MSENANVELLRGDPKKAINKLAYPIIGSLLLIMLNNIIDSVWVAGLGSDPLAAIGYITPLFMILVGVGNGIGAGANSLISRFIGAKDKKGADSATAHSLILSIVISIAFMVLFLIILDPILIFGLFGFPKLGIAGAAIATVIGQIIAMLLAIYYNVSKNDEIKIKIKGFKPNFKTIKKIYSVGIPSIIMGSIGSVMTFGMNKILMVFTSTATAVFGVYFKLQSFVFMPVFGINNGMVPIVSYNFGARNKERMIDTMKISIIYAVCIMIIGFTIIQIYPDKLLSIFNASKSMIDIGIPALKIISLSFLFAGFCIIVGSVFQALGEGVLSMIVSIARQLVVLLPVAYLFSKAGNLNMIWWAFPIAEIASVVLSVIFLKRTYNKIIKDI